jgi:Circadian oscillating protein COP23/Trypsin-like peptidase domain
MKKLLQNCSILLFTSFALFLSPDRLLSASKSKYYCDFQSHPYQTKYQTTLGPQELIYWDGRILKSPSNLKARCDDVSKKIQAFSDNGMLRLLGTRILKNGNPAICAVKPKENCTDDNLLIELPKGIKAADVLQQLFASVNRSRLHLSNEIAFFQDGEFYIDFDKLIAQLNNPNTNKSQAPQSSLNQSPANPLEPVVPEEIRQIAESITVRIEGPEPTNHGSGIIIKSTGTEYTVLTSYHFTDDTGVYTVHPANTPLYIQIDSKKIQQIRGYDAVRFKFHSDESYQVAKKCTSLPQHGSLIFAAGWANPDNIYSAKHFVVSPATLYSKNLAPTSEGSDFVYRPTSIFSGMSGGPVISSDGCVFAYTHAIKQSPLTGRTDLVEAISLTVSEESTQPEKSEPRRINIGTQEAPSRSIPQPPDISTDYLGYPPPSLNNIPANTNEISNFLNLDMSQVNILNEGLALSIRENSDLLELWEKSELIADKRKYYDSLSNLNEIYITRLRQIESLHLHSMSYLRNSREFEEYLSRYVQDSEKLSIHNLYINLVGSLESLQDKKTALQTQSRLAKNIMKILESRIER